MHRVAVGTTFPELLDVAAAVAVAEALVVAGRLDSATVAAASLSRGAARADATPVLREMLAGCGIGVPVVHTEGDTYRAVMIAFGSWELPLQVFTAAFYGRLPSWDEQQPLDRELTLLLDELDHEPWVGTTKRRQLEDLLRATVRAAYPAPAS